MKTYYLFVNHNVVGINNYHAMIDYPKYTYGYEPSAEIGSKWFQVFKMGHVTTRDVNAEEVPKHFRALLLLLDIPN